jgi:ABC-type multidrug transport system ATPase subunit
MNVVFKNAGKRFNANWILNTINLELKQGNSYAVLGANGSGKSTLLQLIAGNITPSKGEIAYELNQKKIEIETLYRYVSYASPYLELSEEFTLSDAIAMHFEFKKPIAGLLATDIAKLCGLNEFKSKQVRYFSSGMKQRLRLALAIYSDTPLLLLDEPCANLDVAAIDWYKNAINQYATGRTVVVCSNNQQEEFSFCNEQIKIENYK